MSNQPPTIDDLRKLTGVPASEPPIADAQDFKVESARSPRPSWTQPLPKLILAGVALMPIAMIAGLFLVGNHQSSQSRPETADRPPAQDQKRTETTPNELEQVRQENAHLKAKAALDGQQRIEAQTQKPSERGKSIPVEPTKKIAVARTAAQPSAASDVVRRAEPPRMVSDPPQPLREPRESAANERVQSNAEQSADALQRWQQLARLGSYGSVQSEAVTAVEWSPSRQTVADAPTVSASVATPRPAEPALLTARIAPTSAVQVSTKQSGSSAIEDAESVVVPTVALGENDVPAAIATAKLQPTSTQTPPPNILHEAEARILEDLATPPALIAGAHSLAVLTTPLVIDGSEKKQDYFTVVLTQPLMDSQGKIALPASTQLMVQVEEVTAGGHVNLSAMTAAWQEQGRTKEITLPTGAIQVRGQDGKPLMAQQFRDKGKEIAALDVGQFVLGAIRGSAGLYTRSNTQVQSNNGTTVVTQENPPPNILAGALEGGTSAILDTISERNQRAVEEIQNRPPIHFIKAGSPVQVFVNQSMQLLI
jgi:hypothetical protein